MESNEMKQSINQIKWSSWRNKPNQIQSFLFENEKSWFDWLIAALLPFPQYEKLCFSMEERWVSEPIKEIKIKLILFLISFEWSEWGRQQQPQNKQPQQSTNKLKLF